MRSLAQFSAREWLTLQPLKHAIKQVRNDWVLKRYVRRRPPEYDAFMNTLRSVDGQNMMVVIAFEQAWTTDWQLSMLARHVRDAFVVVLDNSRRPERRTELAAVCERHGVPYLALPLNPTTHANRSHGMAMSWAFDNVVRPLTLKSFSFLDHDIIPVKDTTIAGRLDTQRLYGFPVRSPWAWQLWAGFCAFDHAWAASRPLNFLYDFSRGLDTGGRNWRQLYRDTDADRLAFASAELVVVPVPGQEPATIQLVDGAWYHIGGVGYGDHFQKKEAMCRHLAGELQSGKPWDDLVT